MENKVQSNLSLWLGALGALALGAFNVYNGAAVEDQWVCGVAVIGFVAWALKDTVTVKYNEWKTNRENRKEQKMEDYKMVKDGILVDTVRDTDLDCIAHLTKRAQEVGDQKLVLAMREINAKFFDLHYGLNTDD